MVYSLKLVKDLYLISGFIDKSIRVWNLNTLLCICIVTEHSSGVRETLLMDNEKLFSTSLDKSVLMWDLSKINEA